VLWRVLPPLQEPEGSRRSVSRVEKSMDSFMTGKLKITDGFKRQMDSK